MFQLSIEFLFLLNNRATRPHGRIPAGHRELAPLAGACAVQFATVPARPDSLVHTSCRRLSWQAPGSRHMAQTSPVGCGGAGWGRLCFGPCPGPRLSCPRVIAPPSGCCLLPTDGLLWSRQSLRGRFCDGAFLWRRRAQRGQGRLCPGPHSWEKAELGLKWALLSHGGTFPAMPASLLSPASGLLADLPVPAGGSEGGGAVFQML